MNRDVWSRLDELLASSELVIDRPKETRHPRYPEVVFPLDYGYLENTTGGDGDGIDVWVGTAGHRRLTAIAATVDMKKRDAEIKLIIGCTDSEVAVIEAFYSGPYMSAIVIKRD
jgi:inorganic pyrophosphatase